MNRFLMQLAVAAITGGVSAASASDTFTMSIDTDQFASVNLQVRLSAPNRAAYLQEGSPYKVEPNWQPVDSILCGQTTRDMQVWINPAAARATPQAKLTAEFALTTGTQPLAQTRIERDIASAGAAKGFTHVPAQDFTLVINRNCR